MREGALTSRELARQAYSFGPAVDVFRCVIVAVVASGSDCREATIQEVHLLHSEDDRSANGTASLNGTDTYEIIVRLGPDLYSMLINQSGSGASNRRN
jgi:hypothetical protein